MTLIVYLFIIFLNNGTFPNLLQQRNFAVVNGLIVTYDVVYFNIHSVRNFVVICQTSSE